MSSCWHRRADDGGAGGAEDGRTGGAGGQRMVALDKQDETRMVAWEEQRWYKGTD